MGVASGVMDALADSVGDGDVLSVGDALAEGVSCDWWDSDASGDAVMALSGVAAECASWPQAVHQPTKAAAAAVAAMMRLMVSPMIFPFVELWCCGGLGVVLRRGFAAVVLMVARGGVIFMRREVRQKQSAGIAAGLSLDKWSETWPAVGTPSRIRPAGPSS